MSDYMFILENHLSVEQRALLDLLQQAAAEANLSLFLTGGALRDMLGGFPIRDLDFTVDGNAVKFARDLARKHKAEVLAVDEVRKSVELRFPSGARCAITMAHTEKFSRPGAKPQVSPATIHEDLRCRDFTINAIALSLNRASRGLLIDPTNGAGDIEQKELRAVSPYALYDDPVRLLRLVRFRTRFGFTVEEKTWQQFLNAREAGVHKLIPPRALFRELYEITQEPNPGDVFAALDKEGLLTLFSPGLTGAKVNLPAFQKLARLKAMIPFGAPFQVDWYAIVMYCLTEKLTPKERSALIAATQMTKEEAAPWQKLEASAKKLASAIQSAKLKRASQTYAVLSKAPGEQVLYLGLTSDHRLVQDRVKNFLSRCLAVAMEVTDAEVQEVSGLEPGSPKFGKAREERIAAHLDGRVRKPAPPPEPEPPPQQPLRSPIVRGARFR
jgi:tRNA nucleotidyltransferase/poly(A) polymerase